MSIDSNDLYNFLKGKGFNYLYHANTVTTSCTFIESNGLLSRGAVENQNLIQTLQKSDHADKINGVWNDIFLDVVDMHEYFPRENFYGPVLFKFKLEILKNKYFPEIWITKDNPYYWTPNLEMHKKYYNDLNEYANNFDYNLNNNLIQKKMITLKNCLNPLSFNNLDSIILDDPEITLDGNDLYECANNILSTTLKDNGLNSNLLTPRRHSTKCFCLENYSTMSTNDLKNLFL